MLDQLPLSRASRVVADDSGGLWLLLDEEGAVADGALVRGTADGKLVDAGFTIGRGFPRGFHGRWRSGDRRSVLVQGSRRERV
jgi:hypothetical protein